MSHRSQTLLLIELNTKSLKLKSSVANVNGRRLAKYADNRKNVTILGSVEHTHSTGNARAVSSRQHQNIKPLPIIEQQSKKKSAKNKEPRR